MTDAERADILRKTNIKLVEYKGNSDELNSENVLKLKSSYNSYAGRILKALGEKFGIFKTYSNENVSLDFQYSRGSLAESVHKQGDISADFYDFAKMLYVFDDVVRNAVPIEVHTDKYIGTKRANTNLKYDYVLLSAFKDGNYVIPIEFHLREMSQNSNQNNRLYVSITHLHQQREGQDLQSWLISDWETKNLKIIRVFGIPLVVVNMMPKQHP